MNLFPLVSSKGVLRNLLACTIMQMPSILLIAMVSASAQRFPPVPIFPSGGQPAFIATADVNGDGVEDILVSTFLDSNFHTFLTVLLGNGNGGFDAPRIVAQLDDVYPIVAMDFDGDGKPDVALLEPASQAVLVYLNTGGGNFSAPKTSAIGALSGDSMAAGDINGDGKPDLVVATALGAFSFLLGNGDGSFRAPVTVLPGAAPLNSLTIGDVNHDGHLDVVGASGASASKSGDVGARVYLGMGGGTFREGGACGSADSNGQVVLADFHGDGNLDLAVTLYGASPPSEAPGYVLVCPGNGDGTFGAGMRYNAGYTPDWLAAVDMNGDGNADLVVGDVFSNSISVWLNRGDGTLVPPADKFATPSPSGGVHLGDFRHNGRPDVIVGTGNGVDVLANLGGGLLHAPLSIVPILAPTGQPTGDNLATVFATDFDKDGHLELAVAGLNFTQGAPPATNVPLLFGRGNATFVAGSDPIANSHGDIGTLAIGDFNGDGKPDLAANLVSSDSGLKYISIAYNTGTHTFSAGPNLNLPNQPAYFVAGDFNRDGYSDFAVLDGNNVDIYLNQKNGSYSGPTSYHVGTNPTFVYQRDLNDDGKPDLIVTNHDSGDVSILLGKGNGTFAAAASYLASAHPNSVTTGDFNSDGKLDLAVGGDNVTILLGRGDGTFESSADVSMPHPVGFLVQADLRGKGIEDLLCVSADRSFAIYQIYVLYGQGDGSFIPPIGYGAGAFPYWLAVGDFNNDGAIDVAVSASTGINLLLNQGGTYISLKSSAATVKAGQPVTFTATLTPGVPGAGHPTGTIAFKDGAKGIGFVKVNNGAATFTMSSLTKGTHVITASYWGNGFFNPHVSKAISQTVQ